MDFWMPNLKTSVAAAAFLWFTSYLFWKHGSKIVEPIKYMLGFPYKYISKKVGLKCDQDYCLDGRKKRPAPPQLKMAE